MAGDKGGLQTAMLRRWEGGEKEKKKKNLGRKNQTWPKHNTPPTRKKEENELVEASMMKGQSQKENKGKGSRMDIP